MFLLKPICTLMLICLEQAISTTTLPCVTCNSTDVCVDGVCQPRCLNISTFGLCQQCWDFKFYGKHCEKICPVECLNSRCQLKNSEILCTDGCIPGNKGANCLVKCPAACTECERYGDGCIGPCSRPYRYGNNCENSCPGACRDGCDKVTSECINCEPGYRGTHCDQACPDSCIGVCEKDKLKCDTCKTGYRGLVCNESCPKHCNVCEQFGNTCSTCVDGKKGENCDKDCDSSCTSCLRFGDLCTGKCNNYPCSSTCIGHKNSCTVCRDFLFYGDKCETPCPSNCKDGCDKDSGACGSCKIGYSCQLCNRTCPQDCKLCRQIGETCFQCEDSLGHISVSDDPYRTLKLSCAVVATIALVGSIVAVTMLTRRNKHQKRLRIQNQLDNSCHQGSSNDPEKRDSSTYYASKYWEIDENDLDPNFQTNDLDVIQPPPCQSDSQEPSKQFGSMYCENVTLENKLYSSAHVGATSIPTADIEVQVMSCHSDDLFSHTTKYQQSLPMVQAVCDTSDSSSTPDLSLKSTQSLFLDMNHDLSNTSIKYITPHDRT